MKVFDIIKIGSNLLKSKKILSYILDTELLLSKKLDKSIEEILTNLDQKDVEKKFFLFKQYLSRRSKHEPLAYILEEKEFWSKKFEVNKNTLIPRPETELLVNELLEKYKSKKMKYLIFAPGQVLF